MTPEHLVERVDPVIGSLGAAFYFVPETLARGKEIGLDGLRFYFLGRGGVLGDVEYQVVQSAFGYFAPLMVAKMWDTGRERTGLSPRQVGRLYVECSREYGRRHFGAVEGLGGYCGAAEKVVDHAHPAGLSLFAALAAEPLPDDLPARAMQLTTVLRELRGSTHLLAVVASGVEPKVAHYFRRPNDLTLFGYGEDEVPALGGEQRRAIAAADALTDRLMAGVYARLSESERADLAAGVESLAAAAGPAR